MHYEASKVELVYRIRSIIPEPELNPEWSELEKLQWHLGCSIEYLKYYCGPVEIPKIEIGTDELNEDGKYLFAICVNGGGMYVPYRDAWSYITHIFDGMRAVYGMKPRDAKVDIPVLLDHRRDHIIGKSTILRGDKTTEINIRIDKPMPIEMFNGMVALSFAYYAPKDFKF